MKVFIIILIFLCFSEITISQEQHKTIHSIQISAYGSIPNDFMKRYRTTKESFYQSYNQVVDPSIVSGGNIGYDQYYTMGTGITAEYIWTFKNNLSVKSGADMIMHSNYKQAYYEQFFCSSFSFSANNHCSLNICIMILFLMICSFVQETQTSLH
jgi:hypothetical protein